VNDTFLAIINPAAGGGRCRELVAPALARLRSAGIAVETAETNGPGHATAIARDAYGHGFRRFLAVGGDGTSYEIVNGLFPESRLQTSDVRPKEISADDEAAAGGNARVPTLGFLPLGTGNSFLRDFSDPKASDRGLEYAMRAIETRQSRACDVFRLTHSGGEIYYINLASVGFAADVAALRHRRFVTLGHVGYLAAIFVSLARLKRRPFPVRVNGQGEFDRRRCLFLTFNNSKFTGGTMMIAPDAQTSDGLIEYVRWGPIDRLGLLRNLSTLYDGTHTRHPLAERQAARSVEFSLTEPVDVMVDGEVLTLDLRAIEVLPSALRVVV
jgi:diacylglycerol kinase family enzyme